MSDSGAKIDTNRDALLLWLREASSEELQAAVEFIDALRYIKQRSGKNGKIVAEVQNGQVQFAGPLRKIA